MVPILAALAAVLLASVHVVTPALRFLDGSPRSVWLSAAGGVAVAYVFVHFLPELAAGETSVGRMAGDTLGGFSERHVYLIALGGLMAFYGLDRLAKVDRSRRAGIPVTDARGCPGRGWARGPGCSGSTWCPSPSTTASWATFSSIAR